MKDYNYQNCQSLFGYADSVHRRSGGICQLCGCGDGDSVNFDLWRQMTVEHLIGKSQGGYLADIRETVRSVFTDISAEDVERLAHKIDKENTVTACSFCNSTTSRDCNDQTIEEMLRAAKDSPNKAVNKVIKQLRKVLERKQINVKRKVEAIRRAFDEKVEPELKKSREELCQNIIML